MDPKATGTRQRHRVVHGSGEDSTERKDSREPGSPKPYNAWQSVGYVLLAIVVGWWTNVPSAVFYNTDTNRIALFLAIICHFSFMLIFVYLSYYLSIVRGIQIDYQHWQVQAPTAIPVATAFMVASWILYTVALWPVWSWFTMPILFCLLMGMLAFLSLIG